MSSELELVIHKGAMLHEAGCYHQALALYDSVLTHFEDSPVLWNNRGNTLLALGAFEKAAESYNNALVIAPELHDTRVALATCLQSVGKLEQAVSECRNVLILAPEHAEAHWNLSLLLLLQEDYKNGFAEYEWRWKKRRFTSPVRSFIKPQWNGEQLHGKTVLVHAEQGFGDTIQFCRYLPELLKLGASVLFECHKPLVTLMNCFGSGVTVVPFGQSLPSFDYHIPLLSFPFLFHDSIDNIPSEIPYLTPQSERVLFWQSVIPVSSNLCAGLCWAGKSYPDPLRSCPVGFLQPLSGQAGVTWVSLQVSENADLPFSGITDLTLLIHDFADTAALIMQLDLVITIDTAVAHLAGALGKETWVMLPFAPDWRWGVSGTRCAWYPSVRLFRQRHQGSWESVISEITEQLSLKIKPVCQP